MKVILTERLFGAPDGEVYPRWFEAGEEVEGDLAESAILEGKAHGEKKRQPVEPMHLKSSGASPRDQALPETTAKRSRGRPRLSRSTTTIE